jgi:putative hemolysin
MDLIPEAELDRRQAMLQIPSLIKAYLRLGGVVGEGAFVDHEFNTTDVCLIMDTAKLNARQSRIYSGESKR